MIPLPLIPWRLVGAGVLVAAVAVPAIVSQKP